MTDDDPPREALCIADFNGHIQRRDGIELRFGLHERERAEDVLHEILKDGHSRKIQIMYLIEH